MKRSLLILVAALAVTFVACTKDNGTTEIVNTTTLSKQWFVRVQGPSSTSNYSLFSTRSLTIVEVVDTFNTQKSRLLTDTMTLDDHNLLTPSFRSNVRIDVSTRTFGAGQYKNWTNTADSLILKEGKMIKSGGRSRSGNIVDSIYIRYAFKSAPTVEYQLKGHERTGLLADEY